MSQEWNLRSRGHVCTLCGKPLVDKAPVVSALCSTPVCVRPATTTNSTPITTTEALLKPEKASLTSNTPVTNNTEIAPKKTKSERNLVNSRTLNIVRTVAMVIQAWMLNPRNKSFAIYSLFSSFSLMFLMNRFTRRFVTNVWRTA